MKRPDYQPEVYARLFPHTQQGGIYLNHAAISPLPKETTDAVINCLKDRQSGSIDAFERDFPVIEETRELLSRLIGAGGGRQIAFTPNTSFGLNIIAQGLELQPGDEVLIYEQEFPSNVYPWLLLEQKGIHLRYISDTNGTFSLDDVAKGLNSRTKVLAVSAVQFLSGFRTDLKAVTELCHQNGTLVIVDAIQALGHTPIDVGDTGIDALCCGGHKWLMCPQGIGFMYISAAIENRIKVTSKGWLSVEQVWDLFDTHQPLSPAMNRFEPGTFNIPAIHGMRASLLILKDIGINKILNHVLTLNEALATELISAGWVLYGSMNECERSAILSFNLPEAIQSEGVVTRLNQLQVYVSVRDRKIRFSPYFYTSEQDIRQTIQFIKEIKC